MKRALPSGLTKASLTPEEQALQILSGKIPCTACVGTGVYIWRHESYKENAPIGCSFCRHTGFNAPPSETALPPSDILERYREYGLIE